MNKQQLASRIWESANKMRSKIEANEYKDYILGFIFYKYLSEKEVDYFRSMGASEEDMQYLKEEDKDIVNNMQENIGYFIAYDNLFSTWIAKGKDFSVDDVITALSAFSRLIGHNHRRVYDGIFHTLETGLTKLGETSGARTKAISGLLYLIKDIPMDGKQGYDVLGFIYEYLINMFAANAGKKAGEFYTPHEVSLLMSEIVADHLQDRKEIKIYDPTSGSGSLLINIGHSITKRIQDSNNIKYYAQELKENTYNLTRMNLVMRGILPNNIVTRNGDTLEDDWPYFDESDPAGTYDPLYVDAVVSNPPYSQNWDPMNKEHDPRYARFGLAPKSKADYAFLLHDLYHLKSDGIMTIVLPHGVLFRGGEEGEIRKNLVENDHIDAIIGLPANIFFGTGIPTIIMVLKQKRQRNDVLIIDASKGYVKMGKNNVLQASDIKRIVDTIVGRKSIDKFSKVVTKEEIRANDYNLNIPRYVDSSDKPESWDMYALMYGGIPKNELSELNQYWEAFPFLKEHLFTVDDSPYVTLKAVNIQTAIKENEDVISFNKKYQTAFAGFEEELYEGLVERVSSVIVPMQEEIISREMFRRLDNITLIDPYKAYQALNDEWKTISIDLEIIQTEGFNAVKKVDPYMVTKKKNGKEEEVQEGWVGHILPYELIKSTLLKEDADAIKALEEQLFAIDSRYEELLEAVPEEDKGSDAISEECDAWINKEVQKQVKALKGHAETEYERILIQVNSLINEEKTLKDQVKKANGELQEKIKQTIESLTDEQAKELLRKKWIEPVMKALSQFPDEVVKELSSKVQALTKKYEMTYTDIEQGIQEAEHSLVSMMDDLVGNEYDMKGISELRSLLLGE